MLCIYEHAEFNLNKYLFTYHDCFQVFATPEVHIGFHPDAAASFYLSHLTGHVG